MASRPGSRDPLTWSRSPAQTTPARYGSQSLAMSTDSHGKPAIVRAAVWPARRFLLTGVGPLVLQAAARFLFGDSLHGGKRTSYDVGGFPQWFAPGSNREMTTGAHIAYFAAPSISSPCISVYRPLGDT